MNRVVLPTWYYRQFDADLSLPVPGSAYGGWKCEPLPLEPDKTALVVMHAWDAGMPEEYPGWYRAVEYLSRAPKILKEIFPPLLAAVRATDMKVYHVVSESRYCKDMPGYISTLALPDAQPAPVEHVARDEVWNELNRVKSERSFPGEHNKPDIRNGFRHLAFPKEAAPIDGESIAENDAQLFALCRRDGINHLVYAGFAVNWCLLMSPGGMLDMFRRGLMCSTLREAVTAVENRESAPSEAHKEEALWRVSIMFGMVYGVDDFIAATKRF